MGTKEYNLPEPPSRRQICTIFILLQIVSAAFITPVGATKETADNETTITITELINWIESTINQQTEAVKNVVSEIIEELSPSGDNTTDDKQQPNSGRNVVDWDDNRTSNDLGCHPNHNEASKTNKKSIYTAENDSTNCNGTDGEKTTTSDSSPGDQNEHTDEGETTEHHKGDDGSKGSSTTYKHSTTSRTSPSTTEMSSESPDGTTNGVNSGPSQESKSGSNIPEADALPDINSPIIALIGAICVISGLVAIARRLN